MILLEVRVPNLLRAATRTQCKTSKCQTVLRRGGAEHPRIHGLGVPGAPGTGAAFLNSSRCCCWSSGLNFRAPAERLLAMEIERCGYCQNVSGLKRKSSCNYRGQQLCVTTTQRSFRSVSNWSGSALDGCVSCSSGSPCTSDVVFGGNQIPVSSTKHS